MTFPTDEGTTQDNSSDGTNVSKLITEIESHNMSVVIVGSVTGFFLILLFCVIVLLIKSRISKKRTQEFYHLESFDDSSICKSAPISRKSSPKLQKRLSCPNAYGSFDGMFVQTSAFDSIPSEQMPPQPVQPKLPDQLTPDVSSSLYAGHLQPTTFHSENELFAASTIYSSEPRLSNQSEILFTALYDVTGQQLVVTLIKVKNLPEIRNILLRYMETSVSCLSLVPCWVTATLYGARAGCSCKLCQESEICDQLQAQTILSSKSSKDKRIVVLSGRAPDDNPRDPFVKIVLLPDDYICKTSRTVRQELNPVFNETFTFNIKHSNLKSSLLKFSVYDIDKRRVRHSLGHVTVALSDLDTSSSAVHTRRLESCVKNGSSSGEINIGLTYLPNLEKMKVIVLRVKNVRPSRPDSGLVVRLQHFYGKKPVKVKQTLDQTAGEDINFNESFAFSTSNRNIENFNFTITLLEVSHDQSFDDVELGHVNLGSFMYARGSGLTHWQEMMSKTKSIVTKWHPIVLKI